jgi:hypothetical protein
MYFLIASRDDCHWLSRMSVMTDHKENVLVGGRNVLPT